MATAVPLPARTAANDRLISNTPLAQLTQRQLDYARTNNVPLYLGPNQTGGRVNGTAVPTGQVPAGSPQAASGIAPNAPGGSSYVGSSDQPTTVPAIGTTTGSSIGLQPFDQDAADRAAAKLASQRDALALIKSTLAQYGLPDSLGDWAWSEIVAGKGNAEIMLDLRQRPEFKAEFPEIDARHKAGLPAVSPSEIIAYRDQATQLMRAAGLPPGFFDSKDDFSKFIIGDMSTLELQHRITGAANAMFNSPADLRAEAAAMGMGPGDLVAQWLNPDVAEPLLQRQWTAAELSVAGKRSGWGGLSVTEATDMAQRGVTADQAAQGFGALAQSGELFNPLAGSQQDAITREEQLSAAFGGVGSPQAQQRIEQRRAERKASFAGGGGFATSQSGIAGLGSSPQP